MCSDFAEESIEINFPLPQHRLLECTLVTVFDKHLQSIHKLCLFTHVSGSMDGDIHCVIGHDVLRDIAVAVFGIPNVHTTFEIW